VNVPYLKESAIETAAGSLLSAYNNRFGGADEPPVPVDEIADSFLNLDLRIGNLPELLGRSGVLGATWVREGRVRIDESLDPSVYPAREGRYRFTVAHELGHWELHRPLVLARDVQGDLFAAADEADESVIVCRTSSNEPQEWQANTFAGYLLMPKDMVLRAWRAVAGSEEPYTAVQEISVLSARWSLAEDRTPTVALAREMAGVFNVSGQAMQIRLVALGLIRVRDTGPELFASGPGAGQ
jgi:hypothetical protein